MVVSELKDLINNIGEGLRQLGSFLDRQIKGQRPALQPIPIRSRPQRLPRE